MAERLTKLSASPIKQACNRKGLPKDQWWSFIMSADCWRLFIFHRLNIKQTTINHTQTHKHKSTELSQYHASAVHLIHTKNNSAHHEHICNKGEYHWQVYTKGTAPKNVFF